MEIYQISVFLENQTGKLYELTDILSKNGIDLRAMNIAETSDYGILRVITNETEKAISVLADHGLILSEENFDVEYMYSIFGQPNGMAYMILRVDDVTAVREMLKKHNVHVAESADLGIK